MHAISIQTVIQTVEPVLSGHLLLSRFSCQSLENYVL